MSFIHRTYKRILQKDESDGGDPKSPDAALVIELAVSAPNSGKFVSLQAILDSGINYPLLLPPRLAKQLGLVQSGSADIKIAGGQEFSATTVYIDLKLSQKAILKRVPAVISDDSMAPTAGLPLLAYYDITLIGGQVKSATVNQKALGQPADPGEIEKL